MVGGKISLKRLRHASGLELPFGDRRPDLVVMGFDQGRYTNYAMVQHWYLAHDPETSERWRLAHKQVVWWGKISFGDMDSYVAKYGIDLIGMDSEPNYNDAADYCHKHPPTGPSISTMDQSRRSEATKGEVYLVDQMDLKGAQFKRSERIRQNIKNDRQLQRESTVPVYAIDRSTFLDAVRNRIYKGLTHFPAGLDYDPKDDENLFRHYLSSDKLPTGQWIHPESEPDHWFHADSMCEAAVLASFYEKGVGTGIGVYFIDT